MSAAPAFSHIFFLIFNFLNFVIYMQNKEEKKGSRVFRYKHLCGIMFYPPKQNVTGYTEVGRIGEEIRKLKN